jgi:hypothetical protein
MKNKTRMKYLKNIYKKTGKVPCHIGYDTNYTFNLSVFNAPKFDIETDMFMDALNMVFKIDNMVINKSMTLSKNEYSTDNENTNKYITNENLTYYFTIDGYYYILLDSVLSNNENFKVQSIDIYFNKSYISESEKLIEYIENTLTKSF